MLKIDLKNIKIILSALVLVAAIISCDNKPVDKYKRYELTGYTQGTTYQIIYIDSVDSRQLVQGKVDSILKEIDESVSTYNPNSIISKFNNSDTCVLINEHILNIFNSCDEVNSFSDGAFDPTVKPLVNLWGFGAHPYKFDTLYNNLPDSIDRDSMIAHFKGSMAYDLTDFVGFEYLMLGGDIIYNSGAEMLSGEFNDNFICKDDETVQITFDAIAQGYTSDFLGDYFNFNLGIGDFLINVGGEIVAQGYKMDYEPWMVQIEHPNVELEGGLDEIATVKMDSNFRAIAVSGNYRKFREEGGRKIVHSIDPRTGMPAKTNVLSATVLCYEAALADAYATAFMVMRPEEIVPLVESEELGLYVLLVYEEEDGQLGTYVSTNLEDKLLYPIPVKEED